MSIDRKKLHTGGEVDAYCTKCRMDLNHRIVAMVPSSAGTGGEEVKRVKCLTCDGEHNYRRPAAEREREKEKKAHRAAIHAGTTREPKAAPKAERSNKATWEKSIAGQPPSAFAAYSIRAGFTVGDLVKHSKFGDGVIARVIDPFKVEILFEDGPRTMAQNTQV